MPKQVKLSIHYFFEKQKLYFILAVIPALFSPIPEEKSGYFRFYQV
ncbi:hypothetical protein [Pedobacter jamesrossensis]